MTSLYSASAVSAFYDGYGVRERDRLFASANARLIEHLHQHFLTEVVKPGDRVLDVGCGAGHFSRKCLKLGAQVALVDISRVQLELAIELCARWKDGILGAHHLDMLDLAALDEAGHDVVLCYGSALCYLLDRAPEAVAQMVSRLRPGGTLVLSAGGRSGVLRFAMANPKLDPADFFGRPDYWHIHEVLESGTLPDHPEVEHPARHFFTSAELRSLLEGAGLQKVELGTAPSVSCGLFEQQTAIEQSTEAWETLLRVEEGSYREPGLLDAGEFILGRGVRPGT